MKRTILEHISQLATPSGKTARHGAKMNEMKCISDAAVVIEDGIIRRVGTAAEIEAEYRGQVLSERKDMKGCTVLPGFVDPHTHFLFGGERSEEFMMRLAGVPYMEIHNKGGGIQNTVEATRKLTHDEMYSVGKKRLNRMLSMGITTVEGKSGYGLDRECELRELEVMKELDCSQPVSVVRTYLGGHSVPAEYRGKSDGYIDFMINEMLPEIREKKLAEFADIFCEEGVFSIVQSERFLRAAAEMGFGLRIHADEIVSTGGAELAASLNAASADHLLMISDEGIRRLAASETTVDILPCTAFCLNKPYAPARRMIDAGCAVALASDLNPGSCCTNSVPLIFALAVMKMGMTPAEALCAFTLNAAASLGRAERIGSIEEGKDADLTVIAEPGIDYLVYHTCINSVSMVMKQGKTVYERQEE